MLTPDVVYLSDGGGKAHAAPRPILGQRRVARLLAVVHRKRRVYCEVSLATVNGQPGVVFADAGGVIQITAFAAERGRIAALYTVLNPDKLRHWPSVGRDGRVGPEELGP